MVTRVHTMAFRGMDALRIDVQVQITTGMPSFTLVGLADKAVSEARERVRGALTSIGLSLPPKRITVNLAPADLPKEGSHYDLPIALGILGALGATPQDVLKKYWILGELGLDGRILPVSGALPAAIAALTAGCGLICPQSCGGEAAWGGELEILAAPDLLSLLNHLKGNQLLSPPEREIASMESSNVDMLDIKGQQTAKRALEVAAAGGHHMLLIGPPGTGKSLLAARLPGLLPPLSAGEALEVNQITSLAGELRGGKLQRSRPFRAPHHSASVAALVGGGKRAKPGEISLAHNGVLFLDELPEFSRIALDSLRQPLETGNVFIARVAAHVAYPARMQLIGAMNPCKCGYLSDPALACGRAPKCAADYQDRVSGALLDRFDIRIETPPVSAGDLAQSAKGETSAQIAARIAKARTLQTKRYEELGAPSHMRLNARADGAVLEKVTKLCPQASTLLNQSAEKMRISARGYHRVLRVARSLADLDPNHDPQNPLAAMHISEALTYRGLPLRPQMRK